MPKYIDCDKDFPIEFVTKGFFFQSNFCNQDYFLIEIQVKKKNFNTVVNIYNLGCPQEKIENNTYIACCSHQTKKIVSIDIWGKYYHLNWDNELNQYYHNEDGKEDYIGSLAEIIKKGLEIGLKKGEIQTY